MNIIKAIFQKILKAYHNIWWVSIALILLSFVFSIWSSLFVQALAWFASSFSGLNLILNPHISGFIDTVSIFAILAAMIVCFVNSVILLFRGKIKRFFEGMIILLITFIAFIMYGFLFSSLMGISVCDSIYSPKKDSYYTLIIEPMPTDVSYAILKSTTPFDLFYCIYIDDILDYSEDGSLTEDPKIEFNEAGTIIAIKRGGYYTDAIELIQMKNLTESIPWSEKNREELWENRNDKIKKLLSEDNG